MVTAGFRWPPDFAAAMTPTNTARPHPQFTNRKPVPCPLDLVSAVLATTPQPRRISSIEPTASDRKMANISRTPVLTTLSRATPGRHPARIDEAGPRHRPNHSNRHSQALSPGKTQDSCTFMHDFLSTVHEPSARSPGLLTVEGNHRVGCSTRDGKASQTRIRHPIPWSPRPGKAAAARVPHRSHTHSKTSTASLRPPARTSRWKAARAMASWIGTTARPSGRAAKKGASVTK